MVKKRSAVSCEWRESVQIVLRSGGAGKRLWPLSNELYSKQFLRLLAQEDGSRESMIQRVCRQAQSAAPDVPITIATGREQTSLIRRQLGSRVNISVEPCRRDTFPAIALVSAYLHEVRGVPLDEAVAICPADPYVDGNRADVSEREVWLYHACFAGSAEHGAVVQREAR